MRKTRLNRKTRCLLAALIAGAALSFPSACARGPEAPFTLRYLGHDSFALNSGDGRIVVCDPFRPDQAERWGILPFPSGFKADAVLISHNHADHNFAAGVAGKPEIIRTAGVREIGDLKVTTLQGRHGQPAGVNSGTTAGQNLIAVFERDGCKVVFLGDSGLVVDPMVLLAISGADVVIPNVGNSVIPQNGVMEFMAKIRAGTVVAAHWDGADQLERFLSNHSAGVPVIRSVSELPIIPGMPTALVVMTPEASEPSAP